MTQNYLFIDIDGPLLPGKSHMFPGNREWGQAFQDGVQPPELFEKTPVTFDPWCVRAHNLLAKYGNAKVVIVTNWRRWCDVETLQEVFKNQGLEFEYADHPSCTKRGFSSERYHDIAAHMEDYIEEDARCLIIDDYNLQPLNSFFLLEGEEGERNEQEKYYGPVHTDDDVGIVQNYENSIKYDIRFKWLDVEFKEGLTYKQFKLGANFFNVDWDQLAFEEFGVPIKSQEEKDEEKRLYQEALDTWQYFV